MPRKTYDYLTDETEKVLNGNLKAAAHGLDVTYEAVRQIAACEATDPFAHFEAFYEGLCRGGVSVEPYRSRLGAIEERYMPKGCREASEAIDDQFAAFNEFFATYMKMVADGLDLEETDKLLGKLNTLIPIAVASQDSLIAHKAKLEKETSR